MSTFTRKNRSSRNRPEATADSIRDGWLNTGDIARVDEDGWVFIVDRAKDMVIRGGENVYCSEVEAAIYQHDAVAEAIVFGVPDDRLGEEVAAVIVPREGRSIDEAELRTFLKDKLADVLDSLTERERKVLELRFGLGGFHGLGLFLFATGHQSGGADHGGHEVSRSHVVRRRADDVDLRPVPRAAGDEPEPGGSRGGRTGASTSHRRSADGAAPAPPGSGRRRSRQRRRWKGLCRYCPACLPSDHPGTAASGWDRYDHR